LHHPPYSSGSHGVVEATEAISASETNVILNVREYLVPLFEEYNVDLVFCGHDHLYERSYKNGVHYIVSGGGGAPLYEVNQTPNPYQKYAVSCNHYCIVEVSFDNVTVAAYTKEGILFDQMSLKPQSSVEEWNRYGGTR
jgi:3',5'-cyclic AMP phosphodiesterase CpdA